MKVLSLILSTPLLFASFPLLAYAQSAPADSDTVNQLENLKRQFVASFRDNVQRGCVSSAANKAEISTLNAYCKCYAASFVDRYKPEQLVTISNLASQNKDYAEIITLMMRPESSACKSK